MNIYWLNPPISTRSLYCDLAWINFSFILKDHTWIPPIVNWDDYQTIDDVINDVLKQPVDILCISNYIWNNRLCAEVAKKIKQINPNIIVISGGPNQFDVPEYVDYMCYTMGHGEIFLIELFKQLSKHKKVIAPDFIPYLVTKNYVSPITKGKYEFPSESPFEYNSDYIIDVVQQAKLANKSVSIPYETTRGCPYSCTYCEWGAGGTSAKLSQKPIETILADIELFAMLGVKELDIIDANFGILKRDVTIVNKIKECKEKYGYPKRVLLFGLTKNSRKNKEAILDVLFEGELIDNYFMAIQSISKEALDNVKRIDIELEENLELSDKYKKLYNTCTKVELIMGLPGSTLEDFYNEMDLFQRTNDWFYPRNMLTLLPGTEAYTSEYREKHKLKTVMVGTMENEEQDVFYISNSVINQYKSSFELVIESYSFTKEDFKEMFFMNRAQRILGPMVKYKASIELKQAFDKIKKMDWYKVIDEWTTKLINGELENKEISVIDGKLIEDIVDENIKSLDI